MAWKMYILGLTPFVVTDRRYAQMIYLCDANRIAEVCYAA
jgi:hypothetical protein